MSSIPAWGYATILAGSLMLSLLLTPLALAAATRFRILDHPGPSKSHSRAVPYLGGAAIVTAFSVTVLIAAALRPPVTGLPQLVAFITLGLGLAALGLIDDVRGGLHPVLRVLIETGAGAIIWALGDSAHLAGAPRAVNAVISILWIVGVTNAFNLLDNMDGLSSGTAVLCALAIFAVAVLQNRYLVAALAIALAGCAAGFLRHNFHPARIYMGDAGSLFLGFTLSVLLLKLRENAPTRVGIVVILAIAAIPLFDTSVVVVSRVAHRLSPFQGGRDHTSHRLLKLGLTVRQAVAAIYAAGVICDALALLLLHANRLERVAGAFAVIALLGLVGGALLRIRVYEVARCEAPDPPREQTEGRKRPVETASTRVVTERSSVGAFLAGNAPLQESALWKRGGHKR